MIIDDATNCKRSAWTCSHQCLPHPIEAQTPPACSQILWEWGSDDLTRGPCPSFCPHAATPTSGVLFFASLHGKQCHTVSSEAR